ncbi:hypothetical protein BN109_032 [Yersinia phage phi80-18]|uniref:Uncharacterized protein n=1 Tax=Yersinia phage phi80-18 TaxID=1206559 RepID=I7K3F3_9CAUD|nr:hypothetical protein BN109_032 [Yersinia phage phi80-18]CCI88871.2 hypothetical protein BN109_032 [Yersinia phage phi80-18]
MTKLERLKKRGEKAAERSGAQHEADVTADEIYAAKYKHEDGFDLYSEIRSLDYGYPRW